MTAAKAIRWWPPIGVVAMALLGLAVGRGSTVVDDWFHRFRHGPAKWLLFFTDPRVLMIVLLACVGVALYRRSWRLAAAAVLSPLVAVMLVELIKPLFGRESDGDLAYPSGHTTVTVVVLGFAVLLAGGALWAVLGAVVFSLLGMIGQGVTYHYFTDTLGAVLFGTAIVCIAARLAPPT